MSPAEETSLAGREARRRASWPESLVERALSALAADYRRPAGPAIIAAALTVAALLTATGVPRPLAAAPWLALLATAPIAVIRRFPVTAIGMVLGASFVFLLFGRLSWPPPAVAGWLVALAAAPVLLRRRTAVGVFVVSEAVVGLAIAWPLSSHTPWDAALAEALAVVAAWGAGEMLRSRRQSARDHAAAAERVRRLSEGAVLARERAAIARELHDVVAHHVSMIAVRAATAPYAVDGLSEPARDAFGEIAQEARTALSELRVVLGVLRDSGATAEAAPQPALRDVSALLSRARRAGTDVTQAVTGLPRTLTEATELCGYRVIQEAVTNAGRHAAGSRVAVTISYEPAALAITVRNTARMTEPAGRIPPAAGGYGLLGLRERVGMLGGRISAGPQDDGGFLVAAVLPAAVAPAGPAGLPAAVPSAGSAAAPAGSAAEAAAPARR